MYVGLNGKQPLFLSDFNETWILSTDKKISNFMKIRPLGTFLRDKPAVVGTH